MGKAAKSKHDRLVSPEAGALDVEARSAGRLRRFATDPGVRFVGVFVLLLAAGQFVYYQFVVENRPFEMYVTLACHAAAVLLRLAGDTVSVTGDVLEGGFSMSVRNGCDGLQAAGILVIAIVTFPATATKRILGVAIGAAVILGLNVVRIASLFWAGKHAPSWFQLLHVHIWPGFLILSAIVLWVAWALWPNRPREAA